MNDSKAPYCSPAQLATCAYPARHMYTKPHNSTKVPCNCQNPCEDKVFADSISLATLSTNFYQDLAARYGKTESYWRENAAILQVYFPDLIEERVVHQKSFTVMSLFCNIGGVFGLVLGAGLISIVEIVDFCLTKTLCCCCKRNKRENNELQK